jgi:hypothetical protein
MIYAAARSPLRVRRRHYTFSYAHATDIQSLWDCFRVLLHLICRCAFAIGTCNCINLKARFTLKQKWFYLKTHTKLLKINEINQENPENHFNLGIFFYKKTLSGFQALTAFRCSI